MCKPPHVYIEQNGRALFPNPWTMEIILKQKNWTCPQAQQSLKKKHDFMVLLFGGVFSKISKEPFYWLLQYYIINNNNITWDGSKF